MDESKHSRWLKIFKSVAVLVLLQIIWWNVAFLRNVATIESLKTRIDQSTDHTTNPTDARLKAIRQEAFRRRLMFISESFFFVLLSCCGLYVLYQSLQAQRRSTELQRSFIETVTHETKTPLTAMKLRLESVIEKWGNDPGLTREINRALDEVRRLVSIFEKAMGLLQWEHQTFHFETLAIAETVHAVLRRIEPVLTARGVKVTTDLEAEACVKGDRHCLENCAQSLIENAVHYNNSVEKTIDIRVRSKGHKVELLIRDNGPGIDPQDKDRLFGRFVRGTGTGRIPGTGLGLYLTRLIIEAHDGSVELAESGPQGSCFVIELPKVNHL